MAFEMPDRETKEELCDALVTRAQNGDRDAIGQLLACYRDQVRRTVYAILKSREDAEDVLQDVSIRVLRKIQTFEGRSSFPTWLTQIAINASLMHLRRSRRRNLLSLDDSVDLEAAAPLKLSDSRPGPEQLCLTKEGRELLYQEIMRLPSQTRVIFTDLIYSELTVMESAELQGLSVAAAKSRIFRGRLLLAKNLGKRRAVRAPTHKTEKSLNVTPCWSTFL